MKHTFLDCETLGQPTDKCAVIDFSFFTVDTNKFLSNDPYTTDDIVNVKKFKL
jgi:hypothetical protein